MGKSSLVDALFTPSAAAICLTDSVTFHLLLPQILPLLQSFCSPFIFSSVFLATPTQPCRKLHTMSAIGVPSKGSLPFKRTAKRKSTETPQKGDAIDLFRHSDRFLAEREERAAEKAAKREKKRREGLAKEDHKDAAAQLSRESGAPKSSSGKKRRDSEQHSAKRQHLSLSDDDDDDGLPSSRPLSSRKSSRKSSQISVTSPRTMTRASQPAKKFTGATNVISLDDSDDDDYKPSSSAKGKEKMRYEMLAEDDHNIKDNPDSDSDPVEVDEPVPDADDTASYIVAARQRIAHVTAMRLAQETPETAAELLIDSRLDGIPPLKIKLYATKSMKVVKEAWILKNIQRAVPVSKSVMEGMFFTWKGNKIYDFTTLASMGINPDSNGDLYPSWEGSKVGFKDCTKVHIEAWTSELFQEHEEAVEKDRRRKMGDFDLEPDAEPEPEPEPAKDERIKVILRSKDHGEQNLRVPPDCEVKYLIKAFRTLKKIPEDNTIEMQFDGEKLDVDSTIDNYGIEEMEKVDVYVK